MLQDILLYYNYHIPYYTILGFFGLLGCKGCQGFRKGSVEGFVDAHVGGPPGLEGYRLALWYQALVRS